MLLYSWASIGLLMRRFDFPMAPVIIGMILGPMAETQFRRAMTISNGDWTVFFTQPLSLALLMLAFIALASRRRSSSYHPPPAHAGPAHVPGDA